jgi:hypothetical protein
LFFFQRRRLWTATGLCRKCVYARWIQLSALLANENIMAEIPATHRNKCVHAAASVIESVANCAADANPTEYKVLSEQIQKTRNIRVARAKRS